MKRKWIMQAVSVMILCVLTGCGATNTNNGEKASQNSDTLTLYWMTDIAPMNDEYFNELLEEKGCDFRVEFITVRDEKYLEAAHTAKEEKKTVDLLYNGGTFVDKYRLPYRDFVDGDFYLPFDDYLETELGQKLWDAYEERIWDRLKLNGKHYAVTSNVRHTYPAAVICREDLLEKYDIDPMIFSKDISEWEPALKKVMVGERNEGNKGFYTMLRPSFIKNILAYDHYSEAYDLLYTGIAECEDDEKREVVNYFESDAAERLWGIIADYTEKGYIVEKSTKNVDAYNELNNYFCEFDWTMDSACEIDSIEREDNRTWKIVRSTDQTYVNRAIEGDCVGIASWSEHPDEAFQLLAMTMSDPELSNALVWGKEDVDYLVNEGRRQSVKRSYPPAVFTNYALTEPWYSDPEDKLTEYPKLNAYGITPKLADFHFDPTGMEDTLQALVDEYNEMVFTVGIMDYSLNEINERLYRAGMQEVIDEYNRQLKAWDAQKGDGS